MSAERGKSRRDEETNPTAYQRLRKELLKCPLCPPHRHENAARKAKHGAQKPKKKERR